MIIRPKGQSGSDSLFSVESRLAEPRLSNIHREQSGTLTVLAQRASQHSQPFAYLGCPVRLRLFLTSLISSLSAQSVTVSAKASPGKGPKKSERSAAEPEHIHRILCSKLDRHGGSTSERLLINLVTFGAVPRLPATRGGNGLLTSARITRGKSKKEMKLKLSIFHFFRFWGKRR